MIDIKKLEDLSLLTEALDLECKLAQGQDGKGEVPKDFWSSYSAMANARGGLILLGIREKAGIFSIAGLDKVDKMRTDLFNNLNNRGKVSANLLTDDDVRAIELEGKTVLAIQIPAATRKQKPVFLNGQPLSQTYRRLHEGDRHCDEETVKRMLAEQLEDSRDVRILNRFSFDDLDLDSLHAYRNAFAAHRQDHPWVAENDATFLHRIGGWGIDRYTGEQGLTLAGLLMFGQSHCITQAVPLYFLDYQELPADASSQTRWLDRVVPDGSWSGNLYDFYRRVIRKLTADLKVPFVLKGDTRIDDTPLHQALREALVNTLIHADYSERASVLVIRQPSGFVFRNPGIMRVPVQTALQGGASDCRNRTLHQMFLLINLGERAGSGLPKILAGWESARHRLSLSDSFEPFAQTRLEMTWGNDEFPSLADTQPREAEKMTGEMTGEMKGKMTGRILSVLREDQTLSIPQLAASLGKSESTIERGLRQLREDGTIRRIGPTKNGYWEILK